MNIWRKDKKVKIIGHRGAKGLAPENTLAGIKKAIEYNVDIIEIDVHISKDNVPVVIHDETVNRTTNGSGYVFQLTLKELKKLDAGIKFSAEFRGEKIPTLEEVLLFLKDYPNVSLNIEIKNGPIFYTGIEEKILNLLEKYNFDKRVIISSFDHNSLKKIKEINSKVCTAILYACVLYDLGSYIEKIKVDAIHPHFNYITSDVINTAHSLDIAVNTWIVNDIEKFNKLVELGIDGVGTDYPNLIKV